MDRRTIRPRNQEQRHCFYTRYPEGIGGSLAEDLLCPECGAEEITILEEAEDSAYCVGDLAQCWICKHEFTVTGNCWKPRRKTPWSSNV